MPDIAAPRLRPVSLPVLAHVSADEVPAGDLREAEHIRGTGLERVDWTGSGFHGCRIDLAGTDEVVLDRARLLDCHLATPHATRVRAPESTWRGVEVSGGRVAALEAPGATWDAVLIEGTRIGYLDLRDATLTDVLLSGCRIDTLDLTGAVLNRVALPDCDVAEVVTRHASTRDLDLRGADLVRIDGVAGLAGAVITAGQAVGMAADLAKACGLQVLDGE